MKRGDMVMTNDYECGCVIEATNPAVVIRTFTGEEIHTTIFQCVLAPSLNTIPEMDFSIDGKKWLILN